MIRALKKYPLTWSGVILGIALLGGLALRLSGADFCLPMEQCHPDEHWLLNPALKMLRSGDFNPHFFIYPTLFIYVLLAVFSLTFVVGVSAGLWGGVGGIKIAPFLLAGRIAAGLMGTATMAAIYAAGKRLFDRQSGAVAALALCLMPLHVSNSHFIVTDVPAGFFCALALWAATLVAGEGTTKHYRMAGLLAGFSAAAKYNAALVGVNILIAHWANPRREGFWNRNLLSGVLWCVLGFFIASPYSFFELPRFLDGMAHEIAHYRRGHIGHQGDYNRLFYVIFLCSRGFGPVLAAMGLYGAWSMVRRFRREYLLVLAFPVLYILFLGGYKVRFVRNLMPVLPYLAMWVGFGATALFRDIRATWPAMGRISAWKLALPGLLIAFAVPAYITMGETAALAGADTRVEARQWVIDNIPPGSTIYYQSWSVDNLPPGQFTRSRDRWTWDYYIGTDRLSRKYFAMKSWAREKYEEVVEAYSHKPLMVFKGRKENPFYYTANPTVFIMKRDPTRPKIRAPKPPPPPPAKGLPPRR